MQDIIFGMKAIRKALGNVSETTVMTYLSLYALPIKKIGSWVSSKTELTLWLARHPAVPVKSRLADLDSLILEYQLRHAAHPEWKKEQSVYSKNWYREKGKNGKNKSSSQWAEKNPEAVKAQHLLRSAVKNGSLKKSELCQICGVQGKLHGHHEDYAKPLQVIWVCSSCHRNIHLEINIRVFLARRQQ